MRIACALWLQAHPFATSPEGWQVNIKKAKRIYGELGLQHNSRHPKRSAKAMLRQDLQDAVGPHDIWVFDFLHHLPALGDVTPSI